MIKIVEESCIADNTRRFSFETLFSLGMEMRFILFNPFVKNWDLFTFWNICARMRVATLLMAILQLVFLHFCA